MFGFQKLFVMETVNNAILMVLILVLERSVLAEVGFLVIAVNGDLQFNIMIHQIHVQEQALMQQ
jgi:hypothetical protein